MNGDSRKGDQKCCVSAGIDGQCKNARLAEEDGDRRTSDHGRDGESEGVFIEGR